MTTEPPLKFICKRDLLIKIGGLSYTTVWAWMKAGTFPRSRTVGGKTVWIEDEVDRWMRSRTLSTLKRSPTDAA
jgi:predicted DNA-binding transcriptional regulator AlpA